MDEQGEDSLEDFGLPGCSERHPELHAAEMAVVEAAALHPAEFLSNAAPLPQLEPPADADGGGDVPPPAAAGAGEATMPELPSPSQGGDNGAVDNMQAAAAAAGDAPVAAQNATRGTDKT
ncbi:hypothetical protein THAOC_02252, partial [Thalassiosira oceanica]